MKFSIRNMLGMVLIISFVLALLIRPLRLIVKSGVSYDDCVTAFCMPYYIDFYLLNLDNYWSFTAFESVMTKHANSPTDSFVIMIISFAGILVSGALHSLVFTFVISVVEKCFFPKVDTQTRLVETNEGISN